MTRIYTDFFEHGWHWFHGFARITYLWSSVASVLSVFYITLEHGWRWFKGFARISYLWSSVASVLSVFYITLEHGWRWFKGFARISYLWSSVASVLSVFYFFFEHGFARFFGTQMTQIKRICTDLFLNADNADLKDLHGYLICGHPSHRCYRCSIFSFNTDLHDFLEHRWHRYYGFTRIYFEHGWQINPSVFYRLKKSFS
jgi:hypothetical protein